jgi:uncharacterized protein YqjF (DUF2071 family)
MHGLFQGAWTSVLFIHYEVEPGRLQPDVPFALDVQEGKAYVSVVAFSQERLRFAFGGQVTNWVGRWFANHEFLNVRTYVRHAGESGIFFLAEWVPKRVATWLGPPLFGLPYRWGRIEYHHGARTLHGLIDDGVARFSYRAGQGGAGSSRPCESGSLDEFLLERYVAFTAWHGLRRMFRVEHEPWPQIPITVMIEHDSLLRERFAWWRNACLVGANFSPGVNTVTIGWPQSDRGWPECARRDRDSAGRSWFGHLETLRRHRVLETRT